MVSILSATVGTAGAIKLMQGPIPEAMLSQTKRRTDTLTAVRCLKMSIWSNGLTEPSDPAEVSWRALREIYLKPFQICIKEADPWGLMTSYNRVNGIHVPEHPVIMNQILRGEWGFDGTVMSDWFGTYSTVEGVKATVDLEMPGPSQWRGKALIRALNSRKVDPEVVRRCARRVCQIPYDSLEEG